MVHGHRYFDTMVCNRKVLVTDSVLHARPTKNIICLLPILRPTLRRSVLLLLCLLLRLGFFSNIRAYEELDWLRKNGGFAFDCVPAAFETHGAAIGFGT